VGHEPQHTRKDWLPTGTPVADIQRQLAGDARQVFGGPVDLDEPAILVGVSGEPDVGVWFECLVRAATGCEAAPAGRLAGELEDPQSPGALEADDRCSPQRTSNYGFRRNSLGLRRLGLTLSVLTFAVSVPLGVVLGLAVSRRTGGAFAIPCATAMLTTWFYSKVVSRDWVHKAARSYARSLIETLDVLYSERPPARNLAGSID
jgi:hypothetical protein